MVQFFKYKIILKQLKNVRLFKLIPTLKWNWNYKNKTEWATLCPKICHIHKMFAYIHKTSKIKNHF